jgi:hypothetical protein
MEVNFLQQLDEGQALYRVGQLDSLNASLLLRLLFLELGAVMLFQSEKTAQQYAKKTLDGGAFERWRMFGSDLYNAAVSLNSPEYRARLNINRGTLNVPLLQKILRDATNGRANHQDYAKFTMDAQRSFQVSDSLLAGIRRRIADFEHLSSSQREDLLSDMSRYYAPYGGRGDMIQISRTKSSSTGRSLLKWALGLGALAWANYEFGKRISR